MNSSQTANPVLALVGSPRRDGNSALLARAVVEGARQSGAAATLLFLDDYIAGFLTDEKQADARRPDDRYGELFFDHFLPARAVVLCTPVYWYGMSAQAKAFFDRSFTYYSAAHPRHAEVLRRMTGKRLALAVSSEETYPGAALGIVHQLQEFTRYTHSQFVGMVHGAGNHRGEVARDPRRPLQAAHRLGRDLLSLPYSDYRIDSPRDRRVWPGAPA
ncbi:MULTISPECIES: flavodoxin family protein [Bordetella]|uniref:NAD(P)H dehydrogenase n=1 Tax=Bordetella genomosp. 6 TaxID=463024 RepID=A0ABX4FCQ2_9BORD|nr:MULTISPECIES: flavodoxin family protein [Bordetella]AOB27221.1 NAD(P)H dehydrogenase [Bordetella bronchiseptica]AZW44530.1 flavodoxin family protein [Bordetella bronchiseptica]KCV62756.1 flavin reductase [Bordetella bronchiseptica 99-R-0433]MBN3269937.1 flavodoxin family protein [Bordetella bronchiseptica]OZI78591.1 NAD(P)H dehydrogenase [Bordetella genomosp. 6]